MDPGSIMIVAGTSLLYPLFSGRLQGTILHGAVAIDRVRVSAGPVSK